MKSYFFLCLILLSPIITWGQKLQPGYYDGGLYLAVDSFNHRLTGYFDQSSGWDEELKCPKFSCIFFIEGIVKADTVRIATYYPDSRGEDLIYGTLKIIDEKSVSIQLDEDHGGCWNVQIFKTEPISFQLEQAANWNCIRYVTKPKAYFYAEKKKDKRRKTYIVQNDFICIDQLDNEWAHGYFYSDKTTEGWLRLSDLNTP